jgi:hypothetical protein
MRIGIDFDNTIVCYDQLFWTLAHDLGVVDESVVHQKDAVRDHLRKQDLESVWTNLQGKAYGPRILEASPFPHVVNALIEFQRRGWEVCVISHKTRSPIAGEDYDLHAAARKWLVTYEIIDFTRRSSTQSSVFFELTKREKLQRIIDVGCDWFIDDLPELLTDSAFPQNVGRILFDPHHRNEPLPDDIHRLYTWRDAVSLLTAKK